MNSSVRTRFPPSPTGSLHVGSLHTALFAWLFARHSGGALVLRIEDTDMTRLVPGSVEAIYSGLRWLGIDWDEGPDIGGPYGPYVQSQRLDLYQQAARRLVDEGHAYYCYCSQERLEAMRAEQEHRHLPPGYDRRCRNLTPEERNREAAKGIVPVVRFKTPLEGVTAFHDVIWGDIKFDNRLLDDLVLLKSDGYPTYHLANVVDDHGMNISHVIRGEEWHSSTPRHIQLYAAFGWEPPVFAHLPLLIGADRAKLSKRHGSVAVKEYQDAGYLPEAMMNFLALLGWSLDDKTEIFSREDLIRNFSLERVSKTPATFNVEKLKWLNGLYIRKLAAEDFASRALPFLERDLTPEVKRPLDFHYVRRVTPLIQERAKLLGEMAGLTHYFFVDRLEYETKLLVGKDMTSESTVRALAAARDRLAGLASFDEAALEGLLRPLAVELGLKTGQLFAALRTAVTGETATPPLFQTMAVLGRERCLTRIDLALDRLRSGGPAQ